MGGHVLRIDSRSNQVLEFFEIKGYHRIPFQVEKQCETYSGSNVRLRYFVRLTVMRTYAANSVAEQDIIVQLPSLACL